MDIVALLPFIVLIGAMFLMTRSAKNKQRAAQQMRDQMQPGTGVRTIGGLYATVKEVNPDTVVVEIAPGVHATFAKTAIGAVLEDEEYHRIVNGTDNADPLKGDALLAVPDSPAGLGSVDLGKSGKGDDPQQVAEADKGREADSAEQAADAEQAETGEDAKADATAADAATAADTADTGDTDKGKDSKDGQATP